MFIHMYHKDNGEQMKMCYNSSFFYFSFATKEPNGLLLYNGRFNEKHDFIAMEIINEQIQLTFSAGTELSNIPDWLFIAFSSQT